MATTISGNVEDRNGVGIENIYVSGAGGSDYTNSGGSYWYTCTEYGNRTITASKAGYVTESQVVYITFDHSATGNFTVATGHELHASVEGTVLNTEGDPVNNMMVWGEGILGTTARYGCTTQSNGSYVLPIFTGGDYMIECGKNNFNIISAYHYSQVGTTPASTTTVDFTSGAYAAHRLIPQEDKLCIFNRSIILKDDLDIVYYNISDNSSTEKVYAKVRKWTGSTLNVYLSPDWNSYTPDGSGGSQYD